MKKFSEFYHDLNGEFRENFPLANLTWFKVGGKAEVYFAPKNTNDLINFLKVLEKQLITGWSFWL